MSCMTSGQSFFTMSHMLEAWHQSWMKYWLTHENIFWKFFRSKTSKVIQMRNVRVQRSKFRIAKLLWIPKFKNSDTKRYASQCIKMYHSSYLCPFCILSLVVVKISFFVFALKLTHKKNWWPASTLILNEAFHYFPSMGVSWFLPCNSHFQWQGS